MIIYHLVRYRGVGLSRLVLSSPKIALVFELKFTGKSLRDDLGLCWFIGLCRVVLSRFVSSRFL